MFTRVVSRGRLILLGVALSAALAVPTAAFADTTGGGVIPGPASNGATIELGGGALVARVVVNVRVSFTCDPFLVYDWDTGTEVPTTHGSLENLYAVVVQASGRTINSGSSDTSGGDVTCDGTTANVRTLAIVADTSPWKSGAAVAGASAFVSSPDFNTSHYASTGAIAIKIGK